MVGFPLRLRLFASPASLFFRSFSPLARRSYNDAGYRELCILPHREYPREDERFVAIRKFDSGIGSTDSIAEECVFAPIRRSSAKSRAIAESNLPRVMTSALRGIDITRQ